MKFTIQLDRSDWKKYQTYLQNEFQKGASVLPGNFWVNILLSMMIAFLLLTFFPRLQDLHWPTAIVVSSFFLLTVILFLANMVRMNKAFEPSDNGIFIGEHHFKFDEEGIRSRGRGYEGRHDWSSVMKLERSEGMILIFLDSAYAFLFLEQKLDNPDKVYDQICEYLGHTKKTD